jgi:hypothetical protein
MFVQSAPLSPSSVFSASTTMERLPMQKTRGGVLEATVKAQLHLDLFADQLFL